MTVDGDHRAVVVGSTSSSDFPLANANDSSLGGTQDAFLTRLSADGNSLSYSTYWGGSSSDTAHAVAVTDDGKLLLVGETASSDFPTRNAEQGSLSGSSDAFVGMIFSSVSYASSLPSPQIVSISSDTGASSSDKITSDTTLSFTGTSLASGTIYLYEDQPDGSYLSLGSTTADGSGNWTFDSTGTSLSNGPHAFLASMSLGGDTSARSDLFFVNVDTTAPTLAIVLPENQYSLQPTLRVVATDLYPFAPTTTVTLDVDLNNDGDFLDAGELGHSLGLLVRNAASIRLATAISVGTVGLRARVTDLAGNEATTSVVSYNRTGFPRFSSQ